MCGENKKTQTRKRSYHPQRNVHQMCPSQSTGFFSWIMWKLKVLIIWQATVWFLESPTRAQKLADLYQRLCRLLLMICLQLAQQSLGAVNVIILCHCIAPRRLLINNNNIHTHNGYRQQPNRTIIAVLVELINLNQAGRVFVNGCHLRNFLGKKKGQYTAFKICALRNVLHVTRKEL